MSKMYKNGSIEHDPTGIDDEATWTQRGIITRVTHSS